MGISSYLLAVLATALLAGCSRDQPADLGVCYIASGSRQFVPIDRDIANLETCAARLEVMYLRERRPVTGLYGGVYVLIDGSHIDAKAPDGPRTRLLSDESRQHIDADIGLLLADQGRI